MMPEPQDHRHERLRAAKKRLSTAESQVQRLQGRLQAAREDQARVEAECRAKGVDPADLDRVIVQLEQRYDTELKDLEAKILTAEAEIAPYLEETP